MDPVTEPHISQSESDSFIHADLTESTHEQEKYSVSDPLSHKADRTDSNTLFWPAYNKVATDYDAELLKGWNASLDILLIFAALFSVINTIFVIESYKGLRPDPADVTNTLLRALIIHRNDNTTLTSEELYPRPEPSSITINCFFVASLSCSLSAAFGALIARQWVGEQSNVSSRKVLDPQFRQRQERYRGPKAWDLRPLIDLLPILLQISILLFIIGLVHFLWVLDRQVAQVQLLISSAGLGAYLITIVIGVCVPDSPFQTPLTRSIPRVPGVLLDVVNAKTIFHRWAFKAKGTMQTFANILNTIVEVILFPFRMALVCIAGALTMLLGLMGIIIRLRHYHYTSFRSLLFSPNPELRMDMSNADSVVWLLQNSEDPATIVTTLHASLHIPSHYWASRRLKWEDLYHRLCLFHDGILPPSSEADETWIEKWDDKAVMCGIALLHIFKSQNVWSASKQESREAYRLPEPNEDPRLGDAGFVMRILIACSLNQGSAGEMKDRNLHWMIHILKSLHLLPESTQISIELPDASQSSTANVKLTTSISLPHLALDIASRVIRDHFSEESAIHDLTPSTWVPEMFGAFCNVLYSGRSPHVISHVSTMTALIKLKIGSRQQSHPWSYLSEMNRNLCLNWLNSEMDTPDKSKTVLENIIVALSLMDMDKADPVLNVYRYLLREIATLPGDESLRGNESKRISGLLPEILLRLSRMYDDQDTLYILLQQLIRFNPHFHLPSAEYKEDLLRLFTNEFSRTDHHNSSNGSPQSLRSSIEGWMCYAHVEEFDDIFQRIYVQFHNGTTPLSVKPYQLCRRILVLDASTSMNPEATLGLQLAIAMKQVLSITYRKITDLKWDWERGDELLIVLIRHMMTADSDLRWPLYLPPQTIKYMCDKTDLFYRKHRGNQLWSDMFRSSRGIPELLHKQDLAAVWLGDAILLIWRGAMRAYQKGRLPGNWTPFVFYDFTVLQIMLGYYEHVTSKYYLGLDLSTLADYFEKALSVQHPGDGNPASQTRLVVQSQYDRNRIRHVLNQLGRAVDI